MSFMNRLANSSNRFQGTAKRVLCVCSAGLLRSPTAANVLHKEHGYNTRAAGVAEEYALIPLDPVLISWANEVVWVEQRVYDEGWRKFSDLLKSRRNVVLSIPDMYEWGNPTLETLIMQQYGEAMTEERTDES